MRKLNILLIAVMAFFVLLTGCNKGGAEPKTAASAGTTSQDDLAQLKAQMDSDSWEAGEFRDDNVYYMYPNGMQEKENVKTVLDEDNDERIIKEKSYTWKALTFAVTVSDYDQDVLALLNESGDLPGYAEDHAAAVLANYTKNKGHAPKVGIVDGLSVILSDIGDDGRVFYSKCFYSDGLESVCMKASFPESYRETVTPLLDYIVNFAHSMPRG